MQRLFLLLTVALVLQGIAADVKSKRESTDHPSAGTDAVSLPSRTTMP